MAKRKGFSIRIFLPDGTPDGLRIIEKSNWSGRGVMSPRALLPEAKTRDEFSRAGVYVLIGPSESGDVPRVYVGEGDPVRPRLEQHFAKKDFWTTVIFFVSKDDNLNKAHVQHLESRLVALAREAKRSELENGNIPAPPSLSEADIADVEGFLDEVLLCFPVLGVTVFEKASTEQTPARQMFMIKPKGIDASGYEETQGFVVRGGSQAVLNESESLPAFVSEIRRGLLDRGIIMLQGDRYVFTQDYSFTSPSTAASVILARNANGRMEWVDNDGRTLKSIQEQAIEG